MLDKIKKLKVQAMKDRNEIEQDEIDYLKSLGFHHHTDEPEEELFSKIYSLEVTFWIQERTRLGQLHITNVDMYVRGDMLREKELRIRNALKEHSKDLKLIRAKKILIEK